jgi:hypothetical protein
LVPFHADSVFCMIHQSLINRQFIFQSNKDSFSVHYTRVIGFPTECAQALCMQLTVHVW